MRNSLGLLLLAALLEAGGDALIRTGLNTAPTPLRLGLITAGGSVLLLYGLTVNAPDWDFGRSLGVYVAMFFVVAQAINLLAFRTWPTPGVLVGGTLIVAGGVIVALWTG